MAKKTYKATNSIQGLGDKEIAAGQRIQIDEERAEPFVKGGSLVLDEDKPVEKPTPVGDDGKGEKKGDDKK